jgi:hypothetical protein
MNLTTPPSSWNDLRDRFGLIAFKDSANYEGFLLDTNFQDAQTAIDAEKAHPGCVWTLIDCDGFNYVSHGYHLVNRMGYFVTNHPFNGYMVHDILVGTDGQYDEWLHEVDSLLNDVQMSSTKYCTEAMALRARIQRYEQERDGELSATIDHLVLREDIIKAAVEWFTNDSGRDDIDRLYSKAKEMEADEE